MRMKEDAMNNGQTKPGYNLQILTENQFITDFALFPNLTDTLTLIPFFNSFLARYGYLPSVAVADSGYGSEENYRFMDEAGMEAYVKYNRFHLEQRPRYNPNPFHHDNFHYNADEDYYVCPMGQHMTRVGTSHTKSVSGYRSESARYFTRNCKGCPLRCLCYKSRGDRRAIEVKIQTKSPGTADIRRRSQILQTTMYRTGGGLRTDEVQHGIQTLPPLRKRHGHNGLCLLRHCLQHKENVLNNSKTGQKRGKYAPS